MPTHALPSEASQPHRKRRKARLQLSCNECRRLKMKCDRQTPCGNCVRRECPSLCVSGRSADGEEPPQSLSEPLESRLSYLESLMSAPVQETMFLQRNVPRAPSATTGSDDLSIMEDPVVFPTSAPSFARSAISDPPIVVDAHTLNEIHEPILSTSDRLISNGQASSDFGSAPLADIRLKVSTDPEPETACDDDQSHGTLMISGSGRSTYLGRTAGGEWLKNQEAVELPESPRLAASRFPSPEGCTERFAVSNAWDRHPAVIKVAFPFNTASKSITTATLVGQLPPYGEARTLIDCYYRHFSWHFNVITRASFDLIADKVFRYAHNGNPPTSAQIPSEHLALVFIVLAMGTYYNLEVAPDDSMIEDYLTVSRACLSKADFLANNTMAGIQTLFIMSHLTLSMDSGKNGDQSWPLWGLTTRAIQAMGLHRDGERWSLPQADVDERRRVFWECHATDVIESNCFSRPGAISLEYIDTRYPTKVFECGQDLDTFQHAKFDLSKHFGSALDHSMKVKVPAYSAVTTLHDEITKFELNIPFNLRCRPVLTALPSLYPDPHRAIEASPPTNKRDLQRTFQQITLAMNISELFLFLHRPYFARALNSVADPTRSPFGLSYLSVVERCNAILVIVTNIYSIFPQTAARHWWLWYHAFNAATCMGTLILKNPQNVLTQFALGLLDSAIEVYSSVVQNRNSPRMAKNLRWLLHLRQKVRARLEQSPETMPYDTGHGGDDIELLDWRTRLIQRAGQGIQPANIAPADLSTGQGRYESSASTNRPFNFEFPSSIPALNGELEISGDALLNSFSEPAISLWGNNELSDIASMNWWNLGFDAVETHDSV